MSQPVLLTIALDGISVRRQAPSMIMGIFALLGALAQWHAEYRRHRMAPRRLPPHSAVG